GLKTHFQQQGLALDWVLYADYDALVEAFVTREIDLAWNGPISYVHIKQRLHDPCRVVAMRDVDINFSTQLFTRRDSSITTLADLKGKRVALGSRGSAQAGLLPYYFLKQHGLDPQRDLAACTFAEEREPGPLSDERAVVELVRTGEYDAGVSGHCRYATALHGRQLSLLLMEGAYRGVERGQRPRSAINARSVFRPPRFLRNLATYRGRVVRALLSHYNNDPLQIISVC